MSWMNLFFIFIHMDVYMCMSHMCICLQKPEEGVRFPGTGVTGSCVPPDVGSGKQT